MVAHSTPCVLRSKFDVVEFAARYSHADTASVPLEKLVRALLLEVLYTIRSEHQLVEKLDTTCCSDGF